MNGRRREVVAVIGAQYGSEGKGKVVDCLIKNMDGGNGFDAAVRTGGPNAGHTFHTKDGKAWVMQSIPCAWEDPTTKLVIGAGALFDPYQIKKELELIEAEYGEGFISSRLYVDPNAAVLADDHRQFEGGVGGDAHAKIGSTGKGVGIARAVHIARGLDWNGGLSSGTVRSRGLTGPWIEADTVAILDGCDRILLEGTQGAGLSLFHGPWPKVTSADIGVASMMSEAGVPPNGRPLTIWYATRSMPIRVAGPSGPLHGEMTWEEVSESAGREVIERTTVTKKVRRIGRFDIDEFRRSVMRNGPGKVFITFCDYLDKGEPVIRSGSSWSFAPETKALIELIESIPGVTVAGVSTGPKASDTVWLDEHVWS
jgi:adenylosuccinate synthase